MEIALQAGTHVVTLDFLDTPPRRVCKTITLCSSWLLIVLILAAVVMRGVGRRISKQNLEPVAPLS